ncbi:hypothetical protein AQV86_02910 [Nanohaloarchaea archaeon SG9]|nr:hypothetical protein AQV86_02910 [Nanohaloarchaea archaeon SG9]
MIALAVNVSAQQYETNSCNDPDSCDFNLDTDPGELLIIGHASADTGNNCDWTFNVNLNGNNVVSTREGDSDWTVFDNQAIVTLRDVNSGSQDINVVENHECSPNWRRTQVSAIQVSNSWGTARTSRCNDPDGCDFNINTGSGELLLLGYSSADTGNNDDWTFGVDLDGTTEASVKEGDSDTTVYDNQFFSTLVDVNSGSHDINTWENHENNPNWRETQVVAIEIPQGIPSSSVQCNDPDNCDFNPDSGGSPVLLSGHSSASTGNNEDWTFNLNVDGNSVASSKEGDSDISVFDTQGLSTIVGGGNLNINTWESHEGSPNWRETQVSAVSIVNPDSPTITDVNYDKTAGDPATIQGTINVDIDNAGGNAPNNQLESCTVTAEGVDSGGQVNLNTNINGDSCSFSVDNNQHGNWNPDEELRFEMSVEDSYGGTDDLTGFEQFPVNPPNAPALAAPGDDAESVSTGQSLEVTATHPDGLEMDVRFYVDDGSGFSQVGPTRTASDGETVSVSPGFSEGTEYDWYAEAETQDRTNESDRWHFTTNHRPSIQEMDTQPKTSDHGISFTATVREEDGRSQIDSCELEASGGGGSETYTATVEDGETQEEAVCSVDDIGFEDSSWSHLENLDLELTVTDQQGLSATGSSEGQFPNHRPVIKSLEASEYVDREAFEVNSLIRPVDVGSDEMRGCTVVLSDEDNSYTAGSMTQVNSTHVRCEGDDLGPSKFPGLDMDEELEVEVRATDIHGGTALDSIMYNLPTGIDYQYSAMIIDSGGIDFLPYQVSNNGNGQAEFSTELQNVNASFTANGEDSRNFTLDSGQVEQQSIRISPDVEFTGTKELRIITENLETGIQKESTIPIHVREAPKTTERPVPGIGTLQLLVLFVTALILFSGRKSGPQI